MSDTVRSPPRQTRSSPYGGVQLSGGVGKWGDETCRIAENPLKLCNSKNTFRRFAEYLMFGIKALNTVLASAVLLTLCWRSFGRTWLGTQMMCLLAFHPERTFTLRAANVTC